MKQKWTMGLVALAALICLCFGAAFTAQAADDINLGTIAVGETKTQEVVEGQYYYYTFTPQEAGKYIFSYSCDGYVSKDVCIDSNNVGVGSTSYYIAGGYRVITETLQANATYRFRYYMYYSYNDNESESISVSFLGKAPEATKVQYIPEKPYELYQNTNGWMQSNGKYSYNAPSLQAGDQLQVTLTSGETKVYTSRRDDMWSNMYFYDEEGAAINYYANSIGVFEGTGTAKFTITFYDFGQTVEVPVTIKESDVQSFRYEPKTAPQPLIEGFTNSYTSYDNDNNPYTYYYYYPSYQQGDRLVITKNDGSIETYTYQYYETNGFYNDDDELLEASNTLTTKDTQSTQHWTVGGENYYYLSYQGISSEPIAVELIANPVESFTITPANPIAYFENTQGEWQTDNDNQSYYYYYFDYIHYYRYLRAEGAVMTVKDTDGKTIAYTYRNIPDDNGWSNWNFYDADGNRLPYQGISYYTDQSKQHWTKGGENYVTVTYLGKEAKVPVTIKENTIASVRFEPANADKQWIEGYTDGNYTLDDDNRFYYFYLYSLSEMGSRLIITHKDTTVETYTYKYINGSSGYYNEAGEAPEGIETLTLIEQQYKHPWVPGGAYNYYQVSYLGVVSDRVNVNVVANPVESFTVTPARSIELYENFGGEERTDDYGNPYFEYYFNQYNYFDTAGSSVTVKFTDSDDPVTYTYQQTTYTDEYGDTYNTWGYVDSNGNNLPYTQDASLNSYTTNQYNHPWTKGGENYVTIYYMGREYKLPVTLKENDVAAITLDAEDVEVTEGTHGNMTSSLNENDERIDWYRYFYSYYNIKGITVRYTDGNTKDYRAMYDEDDDADEYAFIADDGDIISTDGYLKISDGQSVDSPWGVGTHYITVSYLGAEAKVTYRITESPIKAITADCQAKVLLENYNGNETTDTNDNPMFWYSYNSRFTEGDTITVTDKDNHQTVYTYQYGKYYDEEYDENIWGWRFFDSSNNVFPFTFSSEDHQYDTPWTPDRENYITYSAAGCSFNVRVIIQRNTVSKIAFTPAKAYAYIEGTNGYFDEDEGYFCYSTPSIYQEGNALTVTDLDGNRKRYVYSEDKDEFVTAGGEALQTEYLNCWEEQYDTPWTVGGENYFTVSYMGKTCSVPITIQRNNIKEIAFAPAKAYEYMEGTHGYYNEDAGCFYYSTPSLYQEGNALTVTDTSDNSKRYVYSEDEDKFLTVGGEALQTAYLSAFSNQGETPWTVGSENYFTVSYMGKTCSVPVTIKKSTLVDVIFGFDTTRIANVDGRYRDIDEDDETAGQYFVYYANYYRDGDTITLCYQGGSKHVYTYSDRYEEFRDADGEYFPYSLKFTSDQSPANPWGVGEHVFEATCGSVTKTITITVQNPSYSLEKNGGTLSLGETKTVSLREGQFACYTFTPAESGKYEFSSLSENDTYGYLYDGATVLKRNDDGSYGTNFSIVYDLVAGKTYTLKARFYSSTETGNMPVKVESKAEVITKTPTVTVTENGAATENISYRVDDERADILYIYYNGDGVVQSWSVSGANVSVLNQTENAYTIKLLQNADAITVNAVVTYPEHVHTYITKVIEPTCTEDGYTLHTCPCGDEYRDNTVEAYGHDWDEAAFEWSGYESATATMVCKTDASHVWTVNAVVAETANAPATATENGSITYTATATFSKEGEADIVKTDTRVKTLPATGYTYRFDHFEWAEDGKTAKAVMVANEDDTFFTYEDATVTSEVKKAADCTHKGTTTYTATYNEETDTKDVEDIRAIGHQWGNWEETTPVGCFVDGEETRQCTLCTAVENRPIQAPDRHIQIVIDQAVEPTTTSTGLTQGSHCEACHEVLVAQKVRDKLAPATEDNTQQQQQNQQQQTNTATADTSANKGVAGVSTETAPAVTTPAPAPAQPATKTATKKNTTTLTLKTVTVKRSAKKLVLQATLKINGKVAKNKKVTFKFNGKTYTAKTNAKGVAQVTIKSNVLKKLKVGKKVTYQATYSKTTAKKTVKVKK